MSAGLKESTKRYLVHVRLILLQRLCQLIRAGSVAPALNAPQAVHHVFGVLAFHHFGQALGVAPAAVGELAVGDDVVFDL